MRNPWNKFWKWYERRILESLVVSAVILYLQIPHTITAAECFFGDHNHTLLFGVNPITDFLLYGIDLLELIPIVAITTQIIAQIRSRRIES